MAEGRKSPGAGSPLDHAWPWLAAALAAALLYWLLWNSTHSAQAAPAPFLQPGPSRGGIEGMWEVRHGPSPDGICKGWTMRVELKPGGQLVEWHRLADPAPEEDPWVKSKGTWLLRDHVAGGKRQKELLFDVGALRLSVMPIDLARMEGTALGGVPFRMVRIR